MSNGRWEEFALKAFFGGAIRNGGAPGGSGDDGEQVELRDGGAGDIESLGVRAGVRRGEEEAGVVDEGVKQSEVGGREAFEQVAGAEGEAEPEAFGAGAGEEAAAGEALGVLRVGEVEVANVADGLDVVEGQGEDAAGEVEEVDRVVANDGAVGQIAGKVSPEKRMTITFLREFDMRSGRWGRLSHGAKRASRKKSQFDWQKRLGHARMGALVPSCHERCNQISCLHRS